MRKWQTHSNSYICLFQSRGVVHAIASHGDNFALPLESFDDQKLLLRRSSGENDLSVIQDECIQLLFCHFFQVASVDDDGCRFPGTNF